MTPVSRTIKSVVVVSSLLLSVAYISLRAGWLAPAKPEVPLVQANGTPIDQASVEGTIGTSRFEACSGSLSGIVYQPGSSINGAD